MKKGKRKRRPEWELESFARSVFRHALQDRYDKMHGGLDHGSKSPRDLLFDQMKPHVLAIIKLNDEAGDEGYLLTDLPDEAGKRPMRESDRIMAAQEKAWGVAGQYLKEGDKVWPTSELDGRKYYVWQEDPLEVDEVTKKGVIFDLGRDGTARGGLGETFVKLPDDWKHDDPRLGDSDFWLDKADELGIK